MTRSACRAAAVALSLLLAGCGAAPDPVRPADAGGPVARGDPAARGVGQLRRLVVLPVAYTPGDCEWPDAAPRLDQAAVLFLRDWKGYEVVRPPRADSALRLARDLAEWQRTAGAGASPPAALRNPLTGLARDLAGDGVLLIRAAPACAGTAAKALTAIASVVGSKDATLEAAAFEAGSGAPVWRSAIRPALWEGAQPPSGPSAYAMQRAIEEVFQPMENAVPAVLKPAARQKEHP